MNKYIRLALIVLGMILITMFGTYRYIMTHQVLERGNNGTIYSTVFGMTDEYYVEGWDGEYTITKVGNTISVTK